MQLTSTNDKQVSVSFRKALFGATAPEGGLFLPSRLPHLPKSEIRQLIGLSFVNLAFEIASRLLEKEIPKKILRKIVFDSFNFAVPLAPVGDVFALELFHGPTLSFKDFGAQFMAGLMAYYQSQERQKLIILTATSGDTGSAVAAAFHNLPGIEVVILYPEGKISNFQKSQIVCWGDNITSVAIKGTFDDCQRLVKQAFSDSQISKTHKLSSANSINIARLLGQVFYYFWIYTQLPNTSSPLVVSVPSGNFGNLTAGLLAKKMGLPVQHFIAATNVNKVVPKFLQTGKFVPSPTVATYSNSMDVGNPSNFARIDHLYHHSLARMKHDISGYWFTGQQTLAAIKSVYDSTGYVLDPHSAVAYLGLKSYRRLKGNCRGVFLATAHPVKFKSVVHKALGWGVGVSYPILSTSKSNPSLRLPAKYEPLRNFLLSKY